MVDLFPVDIVRLSDTLFSQISKIFVLVFMLSKTNTFKNIMEHRNTGYRGKVILILFFGTVAIIGTDLGIPINGAFANTRAMGIIAGGLLGGPLVGFGTGIIAGVHRWTIGGFTMYSSASSALVEGILAGLLASRMIATQHRWAFAFSVGLGLEILHMAILLLFSQSAASAAEFVNAVGIPIIVLNAFGVVVIVGVLENIFQQRDKAEGVAAHLSLKIADQALAFLRNGLDRNSAEKTVQIILEQMTSLDAVAITSVDGALAFAGPGEDHHSPNYTGGRGLQTESTRKAIQTGQYQVYQKATEIGCSSPSCPLKSKVVVPIKEYDRIIGAIVLYRLVENGITNFEVELALGLAQLISSQLEMGKREREQALLSQAELKVLQAQINPHFLFNALNTIAFYCRKQPDTARTLLMHLADFYRNSLAKNDSLVELQTEMKHVASYVEIEIARFQGKLEVFYEIDPDCQCALPPLILQPIVENSIQHGLYPKRQGGRVVISAKKQDGYICISVEDNGVGMSESKIKTILTSQPDKKSIGLSNVNSRLKLLYPDSPGLLIESCENSGTKVTLFIPDRKGQCYDIKSISS